MTRKMKNELIEETIFCVEHEHCLDVGIYIGVYTLGNSMYLNTNNEVFNERGEL